MYFIFSIYMRETKEIQVNFLQILLVKISQELYMLPQKMLRSSGARIEYGLAAWIYNSFLSTTVS